MTPCIDPLQRTRAVDARRRAAQGRAAARGARARLAASDVATAVDAGRPHVTHARERRATQHGRTRECAHDIGR